jgi:hypothetical protein
MGPAAVSPRPPEPRVRARRDSGPVRASRPTRPRAEATCRSRRAARAPKGGALGAPPSARHGAATRPSRDRVRCRAPRGPAKRMAQRRPRLATLRSRPPPARAPSGNSCGADEREGSGRERDALLAVHIAAVRLQPAWAGLGGIRSDPSDALPRPPSHGTARGGVRPVTGDPSPLTPWSAHAPARASCCRWRRHPRRPAPPCTSTGWRVGRAPRLGRDAAHGGACAEGPSPKQPGRRRRRRARRPAPPVLAGSVGDLWGARRTRGARGW